MASVHRRAGLARSVAVVAIMAGLGCGVRPAQAAPYVFTTIDAPGGGTVATGINNTGTIVGNSANGAFIDAAGGFSFINDPNQTQSLSTFASGINDLGQVVGRYAGTVGYVGFVDQGGMFTDITVPGFRASAGGSTMPTGINDAGTVVGTGTTSFGGPGPTTAISFENSAVLTLSGAAGSTFFGLTGLDVVANGISGAGQVTGTYYTGATTHGFLGTTASYVNLDVPGAVAGSTDPRGISNSGIVVGTYADLAGTHAFVDTAGVFTSFDVPNAIAGTTIAGSVNDSGAIVGSFQDATGRHAFLATSTTTVPEPASLALFGVALTALTLRRTSKVSRGRCPLAGPGAAPRAR